MNVDCAIKKYRFTGCLLVFPSLVQLANRHRPVFAIGLNTISDKQITLKNSLKKSNEWKEQERMKHRRKESETLGRYFNPLNAELNPICHFLALLEVHPILHVSRVRVNIYPTRCNDTQFILSGNCSTCFGWYLHPSSGAQTTVSTASGICHTITATCRYTGCCRYSCLRS